MLNFGQGMNSCPWILSAAAYNAASVRMHHTAGQGALAPEYVKMPV